MPAYKVSRNDGEKKKIVSIVIGPDMYTTLEDVKEADKKTAQHGEVFTTYLIQANPED